MTFEEEEFITTKDPDEVDDPDEVLITEASRDLAAFKVWMKKSSQVILVDSCASASVVSEQFWNRCP